MTNPFLVPPQAKIAGFDGEAPARDLDEVQRLLRPRNQTTNPANLMYHHDTFVVFRPWESCHRCMDAVLGKRVQDDEDVEGSNEPRRREPPTEELPAVGDRVCPHTRKHEYEQLVERIARTQMMATAPSENLLRNGTIIVSIGWWEPKKEGGARTQRF